jgi:hypothetical protein
MAKNLIPEICKMLSVELGEEFKVVSKEGNEQICNFTMAGLFEHDNKESGSYNKELLAEIVCNNAEIVKLPWKPKMNERYWSFMVRRNYAAPDKIEWSTALSIWTEHPTDLALLDKGWVYRTKEEAEAALPAVAKEMGVDYEL